MCLKLTERELWAGEIAILAGPRTEETIGLGHKERGEASLVQCSLHNLDGLHCLIRVEHAVHTHCWITQRSTSTIVSKIEITSCSE